MVRGRKGRDGLPGWAVNGSRSNGEGLCFRCSVWKNPSKGRLGGGGESGGERRRGNLVWVAEVGGLFSRSGSESVSEFW